MQVVRPTECCGDVDAVGLTKTVIEIYEASTLCSGCKKSRLRQIAFLGYDESDGWKWGIPLFRLKRIPPLSELEGRTTEEGLRVKSPLEIVREAKRILAGMPEGDDV